MSGAPPAPNVELETGLRTLGDYYKRDDLAPHITGGPAAIDDAIVKTRSAAATSGRIQFTMNDIDRVVRTYLVFNPNVIGQYPRGLLVQTRPAVLKGGPAAASAPSSSGGPIAPPAAAAAVDVDAMQRDLEKNAEPVRKSLRIAEGRRAALERAEAEAIAAARAAEAIAAARAATKAASSAAAASSSSSSQSSQRTVKSAVDRLAPELRDRIYYTACMNILPLLGNYTSLVNGVESGAYDATIEPRIMFNQLFPTEGAKLTDVCRLVYGEILTRQLQAHYGDMRLFFTASRNDTQCSNVLGSVGGRVLTHCWICGLPLQLVSSRKDQEDCEHRLNVLLALIFTGLYDGILQGILSRSPRGTAEYINLLEFEYGWSHPICNRLKRDSPFVHATVDEGQRKGGETKVSVTASRSGINTTLTSIFSQQQRGYPTPSQSELIASIETTPQWDGSNGSEGMAAPQSFTSYRASRVDVIERSLGPLLAKLKQRDLTAKQLCLRVTRGFLLRACVLAPDLVQTTIYDSLPPEYQDFVRDNLIARTGSSRRRTLRRMRGGGLGGVIGAGKLYDIIEYVVKTVQLQSLAGVIDKYKHTAGFDEAQEWLDTKLDEFEQDTATFTAEAMDRIGVLLDGTRFDTVDAFNKAVLGIALLTLLPEKDAMEVDGAANDAASTTTEKGDNDDAMGAAAAPSLGAVTTRALADAPPESNTRVSSEDRQLLATVLGKEDDDEVVVPDRTVETLATLSPQRFRSPQASQQASFGDGSSDQSVTRGYVKKTIQDELDKGNKDLAINLAKALEEVITPSRPGVWKVGGGFAAGPRPSWL